MSIINNRIQVLDPQSQSDFLDRVIVGQKLAVAITATTGTVYPITFTDGLPSSYQVIITPSVALPQPPFVSAKTAQGFNVTLPGTVAGAGFMDILVLAA